MTDLQPRKKSKKPSMAMVKSKTETSVSIEHALQALVRAVNLDEVTLIETRAKFSPEHLRDDNELQVIVKPPQTRASQLDGSLYCGVRFELNLALDENKATIIHIFAEYSLLYSISGDLHFEELAARAFAKRNAVFNAWPFFRELVHSSVARMSLPSFILSSFRLSPSPP